MFVNLSICSINNVSRRKMIYWSLEVSMVSGAILENPESLKEGT